jgi:predicted nucleic acid-binding Zn ribbon protein
MPLYEYRCLNGHTTELSMRFSDKLPATIACNHASVRALPERQHPAAVGIPTDGLCGMQATRVWEAPAAIHFKGPGFYSTDVKGRQERRRRPNPGDDLFVGHDQTAADIARSL